MPETKYVTTKADFVAGEEGRLKAVISTFDVPDREGDVVSASAFTDGQAIPMVWAHQWDKPIGKGVVHVSDDRAVFDGKLFLDTTAGADAYRTIKAMGDLQEYSWGFRILDAEPIELDGQSYRRITRTEVYEASPVLVGANQHTYTLAIKGHDLSYEDHSERVRVAVTEWLERTRAGSDLRTKEGRPLSAARRSRMTTVLDQLRAAADEIDAMLKETEPAPPRTEADGKGETPPPAPDPLGEQLADVRRHLELLTTIYGEVAPVGAGG